MKENYPIYPVVEGIWENVWTIAGKLQQYSTETLHQHTCHQFLTIKHGVSLLVEEARQQPLYGSMCAFIPAGAAHRTVVIGENVTYQSLYINKRFFEQEQDHITVFELSELGKALFERLTEQHGEYCMQGIAKKCLDLFLDIMREDLQVPMHLLQLPQAEEEQNRKIITYIEQHYHEKLHLKSFTSVLPYSGRHIARMFKQDVRITLFEYIRLYRMLMASVMLHEKEKTITEIAFACGYDSLSSFYIDFNKYYLVTPKEFRKKI